MKPWMGTSVVSFLKCLFVFWCLYFGIWHFFSRTGLPSFETSRGRNSKYIERRTSNAQHRTSNIVDATLHRFINKRITVKTWSKDRESSKGGQVSKGRFALLSLFLALLQFSWCKSMQLIETIFDLIIFNGRPLASLVRLTQTISGRLGRILFPLPFGQI